MLILLSLLVPQSASIEAALGDPSPVVVHQWRARADHERLRGVYITPLFGDVASLSGEKHFPGGPSRRTEGVAPCYFNELLGITPGLKTSYVTSDSGAAPEGLEHDFAPEAAAEVTAVPLDLRSMGQGRWELRSWPGAEPIYLFQDEEGNLTRASIVDGGVSMGVGLVTESVTDIQPVPRGVVRAKDEVPAGVPVSSIVSVAGLFADGEALTVISRQPATHSSEFLWVARGEDQVRLTVPAASFDGIELIDDGRKTAVALREKVVILDTERLLTKSRVTITAKGKMSADGSVFDPAGTKQVEIPKGSQPTIYSFMWRATGGNKALLVLSSNSKVEVRPLDYDGNPPSLELELDSAPREILLRPEESLSLDSLWVMTDRSVFAARLDGWPENPESRARRFEKLHDLPDCAVGSGWSLTSLELAEAVGPSAEASFRLLVGSLRVEVAPTRSVQKGSAETRVTELALDDQFGVKRTRSMGGCMTQDWNSRSPRLSVGWPYVAAYTLDCCVTWRADQ